MVISRFLALSNQNVDRDLGAASQLMTKKKRFLSRNARDRRIDIQSLGMGTAGDKEYSKMGKKEAIFGSVPSSTHEDPWYLLF